MICHRFNEIEMDKTDNMTSWSVELNFKPHEVCINAGFSPLLTEKEGKRKREKKFMYWLNIIM